MGLAGRTLGAAEVITGETDPSDTLTTLRGAGVDVDARRVGRIAASACLVALAVATIVLFVAGAQKNAEITRLRQHGIPVQVTVTRCLGELGGSGSNAAGYSCRGTFRIDGRRYNEYIPGNANHAPGTTVQAVSVPGNPPLLSTVGAVATERASWRVFILPTSLLILLALSAGALMLRRRHIQAAQSGEPTADPS